MKLLPLPALVALLVTGTGLTSLAQRPSAKRIIQSEQAPAPIGPYSQAVAANGFLFVAGQIGLDPQTRQLVGGGIEPEVVRVMENIRAILAAAGLDFRDVVNATIYVKDLSQFGAINDVYKTYFSADFPARATVGVASLPGGANVEIAVVAALRGK